MTQLSIVHTYCGRRTGAAFGIFDVGTRALGELLEEKRALDPQLLDLALHPCEAQPRRVIGIFDLDGAVLQLDAFTAIGLFDGGG